MINPELGKNTQFQVGNKMSKGAPKGPHFATLFKRALKYKIDATDPRTGVARKMTIAQVIVLKTLSEAAKGNLDAVQMVIDRIDGKLALPMEHSGPGGVMLPALNITVEPIPTGEKPSE